MKLTSMRNATVIAIALALLLLLGPTVAAAGSVTENIRIAGTFLTSRMDANGDGLPASWCTVEIRGGLQFRSTQQCINEDVFIGFTPECPGGLYVVNDTDGGTGVGTRTFPSARDQMFIQLTERELCVSALGEAVGTDSGLIVGGIGRYAGVTGTYELEYTGQVQYFDPASVPLQQFGSIVGTGTWQIQFPD